MTKVDGDKIYCSATVFGERVHSWGCARRGTVQRGVKWFCKQHDPERNAVTADAQKVWTFGDWDTKPVSYLIARRTEKEITGMRALGAHHARFRVSDLGERWFYSELDAWQYRVKREEVEIARLKSDLQDARTQLGMAQSRVKALKPSNE